MSGKIVKLKDIEGNYVVPVIGGDQLSATVPLNLGGTGSTTLGQQVGLIGYGNNGVSLETISTFNRGFLYSDGDGRSLPYFVDVVDYIVEQGTTDFWTWRKWNSGIAECWGTYKGTIARYTGTLGLGPCVNGFTYTWDLPFAFTEFYTKTATAQVGNGTCIVTSGGLNDSLDSVALHWASNVASGTSTVNLSIKGRWK